MKMHAERESATSMSAIIQYRNIIRKQMQQRGVHYGNLIARNHGALNRETRLHVSACSIIIQ